MPYKCAKSSLFGNEIFLLPSTCSIFRNMFFFLILNQSYMAVSNIEFLASKRLKFSFLLESTLFTRPNILTILPKIIMS